jgi:tRNA 2-selenouridine synthase
MIESVDDIGPQSLALYDTIIDVRSPAEYAEDHIPGAINLPVLSNEERAEVGTIYVKDSRFRARRLGAAYVARNVANHLGGALADKGAKFRPLLYCWRGGMRSNAMATILSQIGWRVGVIEGGYRRWRRAVVADLCEGAAPLKIVLIDGLTGSAKTDILQRLPAAGVQIVDLEALAAHRGSVFGANMQCSQPSQKYFESQLFDKLSRLDAARPIAIEAESSRIGKVVIPKRLWMAMRAAPRIEIAASITARASYLPRAYSDIISAPNALALSIERLRSFHAKETIEEWRHLADEGNFPALAERLMREHYDPLYDRSRKRDNRAPVGTVCADRLDPDDLDRIANEVGAMIRDQ